MHESAHLFIESVVETFELEGPIYEFGFSQGARSAKGSSPVNRFIDIGYVGKDLRERAEIERLEGLSALPYPSESARTICSINVLEHVDDPRRAMEEMIRLLAPGGILLVCTSLHPAQSGPVGHYWRMTPQGIERLLHPLEATLVGWQGADSSPHTVFGIGCKAPVPVTFLPAARRFLDMIQQRFRDAERAARQQGRWKRWLWQWAHSKKRRQQQSERHRAQFALQFAMDDRVSLQHLLWDGDPTAGNTGTRIDFIQ